MPSKLNRRAFLVLTVQAAGGFALASCGPATPAAPAPTQAAPPTAAKAPPVNPTTAPVNPTTVAASASITFVAPAREGDELVAEAIERTRFGRNGVYDVTVRRDDEVVAEFRGLSRTVGA